MINATPRQEALIDLLALLIRLKVIDNRDSMHPPSIREYIIHADNAIWVQDQFMQVLKNRDRW